MEQDCYRLLRGIGISLKTWLLVAKYLMDMNLEVFLKSLEPAVWLQGSSSLQSLEIHSLPSLNPPLHFFFNLEWESERSPTPEPVVGYS